MTIKDIAELAGVSTSTVSKIVNNKDEHINPETRKRVLEIVKKYNYTPYGAVKINSAVKTFRIAVLLSTTSSRNQFLTGVIQAAQNHGYMIVLLDSHEDPDTEIRHIAALCSNGADGVIWEPVCRESLLHAEEFSKYQIPYHLINSHSDTPSYHIDFTELGYVLTRKMLDYNHTRIGCLLKENSLRSEMFLKGFQKCLYDHHILYTDNMKFFISDENSLSNLFLHRMTAVVSSHFGSSLQLCEQLTKLHYYVPSNLSLASLREEPRELTSYPRISSIRIPYFEFGFHICEELIQTCEKESDEAPQYSFCKINDFDHEESISTPPLHQNRRLISVGSINMDITFCVDRLPESGKTSNILSSFTTAGGKGCNQAIGAARLGHEVALIGKLGNDTDSTSIFQILDKEHVATHGILRDFRQQTGKAYIYTESNGESAITVLSGANGSLTPEDLSEKQHLFENSTFCMISTEIPMESAIEAARLARERHVKTIVKPATLHTISDELLSLTDIFIPNRKEAAVLCPNCTSVEAQADFFFQKGIPLVIITLGHRGCYLKTQDTAKYFPAIEMPAIDTTGGADAFISALASYLSDGFPLENAIQIAMYAAAFCISRQGVVPALTDKNSLQNHIQLHCPELLQN